MHLKKIVISGFKSFADKIVVNFDRGITGIVGPNGSGKSNVIDAVRWVMGEQNAKNLRGEKATDIIFAGSERRKALGMAEVSLVFDNTDEDAICPPEYRHEHEIVLTRRLYADGQREYMINRKPCRLKDIVGFFATTGLGGRSYSMIQQGQVDRILNAKPEDVREILEEAAGTTVYKKRKEEAERKLTQTQLNLSRIDDILVEVEKHLETLSGQVDKAKEFSELSTKLKDEETSLLAHNYHHFSEQQRGIKEQHEGEVAKEAEVLAQVANLESRHTELQGLLDEADPEVQALQEKITIARERIAGGESTLKSAGERMEYGTRRLGAIAEELAEDDANLKVLESQVENARREVSAAEQGAHELNEAIASFEYEVESANEAAQVYQSRMDEFADEIRNVERLIESNKFRTEQVDKDLTKAEDERRHEDERLNLLSDEIKTVAVDLRTAEERAGATQAGLDLEIREKHDREGQVALRYQQIKEANVQRDQLKEKYHTARARYNSLAEIEAGATDVSGTLATLRENESSLNRLTPGLLTDFIRFEANAKELPPKAIAALERWTERLLVSDLSNFNELVRIANKHNVSTLPVCVLSHAEVVDPAATASWAEVSGAEPLRRYLSLEGKADALNGLDRVLDRLYLLPALAIGDEELDKLPHGVIVFTAQGVSFSDADEFIIGGKSAAGLLSRKTELEALAASLKEYEGELSRAQATIDDLEYQINQDRQIVAEIDNKLQQQNRGVLEVMSALQAVQQLHDRKQELIQAASQALERHTAHIEKLNQEKEALAVSRFSLNRELSNAKTELASVEQDAEALLDRKEEVRRQHESKKLEMARSGARAQALRDGYLNSKAQLELLQNKLSRRYDERHRLEQDIETARDEEVQAKSAIEQYIRERDLLQEEFAVRREANAGLIEETRVIDNRLRSLREQHASLQKGLAERNVHLERLRMALTGVMEQAQEKYHLDLTNFQFEIDSEFNHESRSRSVSRLRNKIESMGAVNMMALKEFEEKSERRDFITKQKDEVLSSIDLLKEAITEIEETSLRKFLEVFARINTEFGQLFPILFPTGEGKLELTNPENPMIGGVEIMCRLPGKSQKSMNLFSGGEKALTAMALIFALLRTKPTPYCFLDEVDAPLDEANVGRYNRVLEALSDQFQFIVITHNRRTMEVLDVLYGITMQEPGVSKVVGVDMQKDLPAHLRKAFKDEKAGATAGQPVATKAPPDRQIMGATSL
ncbi:MAG: chromosome segregation protein SMC [Deltaproteobacteria bacterium]|nr:chromosome segregation protein SMC [Deltaproteobacteria bacterium]